MIHLDRIFPCKPSINWGPPMTIRKPPYHQRGMSFSEVMASHRSIIMFPPFKGRLRTQRSAAKRCWWSSRLWPLRQPSVDLSMGDTSKNYHSNGNSIIKPYISGFAHHFQTVSDQFQSQSSILLRCHFISSVQYQLCRAHVIPSQKSLQASWK